MVEVSFFLIFNFWSLAVSFIDGLLFRLKGEFWLALKVDSCELETVPSLEGLVANLLLPKLPANLLSFLATGGLLFCLTY